MPGAAQVITRDIPLPKLAALLAAAREFGRYPVDLT
jgi:hypothetical protein